MTVTNTTLQRIGADRGIALFNYGLLFAAIFTMGVTGLAAIVIAYATRGEASARVKRHLNAQVAIFWTDVLLSLLAIGLAVAGVWLLVDDVWRASPGPEVRADVWNTVTTHLSLVGTDLRLAFLFGGSVLVGMVAVVTCLVAPAIGFIRLATTDPKGVTAQA